MTRQARKEGYMWPWEKQGISFDKWKDLQKKKKKEVPSRIIPGPGGKGMI